MQPPFRADDPSLSELVGQAIDDGKAFLRAEATLLKAVAAERGAAIVAPIGLIVAAVFIVGSTITILLAALGLGIGYWIGPAGGLAVAGLIGLALAGLLGWIAAGKFKTVAKPLPDLTGARP